MGDNVIVIMQLASDDTAFARQLATADSSRKWKVSNKMSKAMRKPFTLAEARLIGEQLGINWAQLNRTHLRTGTKAERADDTANPFTRFASADPMLEDKVIRAYRN